MCESVKDGQRVFLALEVAYIGKRCRYTTIGCPMTSQIRWVFHEHMNTITAFVYDCFENPGTAMVSFDVTV